MHLSTLPWKTAWYDDNICDRFFHEMSRMENSEVRELDTSARWMNRVIIEVGQLAQNINQLEKEVPHASQIRLASEKALKLSSLIAHLAAALDCSNPERKQSAAQPEAPTSPHSPPSQPLSQPREAPLRETVMGLSRRGLSVPEIEVITGLPRRQIESTLNQR